MIIYYLIFLCFAQYDIVTSKTTVQFSVEEKIRIVNKKILELENRIKKEIESMKKNISKTFIELWIFVFYVNFY